MPEIDEPLGELEHLRDVLCRAWKDVGGQDVDRGFVDVEGRLVGVGDLGRCLVLEPGREEHPVLASIEALVAKVADVRDVLDLEDLYPVVDERPPDEVGKQERPEIADMCVAVDGRAAGIHPDPRSVGRLNGLDGAAEGVPDAKGHPRIVTAASVAGPTTTT